MAKLILGIIGEIGSGKDTVADYLHDRHGATTHRFSSIMSDCLDRLGVAKTRENTAAFSELARQRFGEDTFAKVIARDCAQDTAEIVIANGVRRPADIEHLKAVPGFHLIYLAVPARLRYERIRNRGEKAEEHDMSWETFMANEVLPTELAIRDLGTKADVTVDNGGTLEELYRQLDELVKKYA